MGTSVRYPRVSLSTRTMVEGRKQSTENRGKERDACEYILILQEKYARIVDKDIAASMHFAAVV